MAADPARRLATYEDVLGAPGRLVAEVLLGVLYLSPRPGGSHTSATSALGEELGPPFKRGRGGPGGWLIVDEPELHLHDDILVPDLAGWRRERLPALANAPFQTVAPDWVCEVLSPSTEKADRSLKLPIYAREKVKHVWLVNPLTHTLEVLRLDGERWSLLATYCDDAQVRAEPFDAIALDLEVLWADVEQVQP